MGSGSGSICIAYFTGTGGARRVAEAIQEGFSARGREASLLALEGPVIRGGWGNAGKPDLLLLVYAVHALDAPEPVYAWVNGTDLSSVRAAVLSVSGGGEMWPNTGCRSLITDALRNKGCDVAYDRMIVMPSNVAVDVGDHAAMHLLRVLPVKAKAIAGDLLAGRERHDPRRLSPIRRWFARLEKRQAHLISRKYRLDGCNGCGWCVRNCPTGSIEMNDGRPVFHNGCVACLRCVYGCPNHAIKSGYRVVVFPKGFDLDALEKRMEGVELMPVEKCCRGWAWAGVRKYLMDKDK